MEYIIAGNAGLMAVAFWTFLAAVIVAGTLANVWDGIRKRETQHETVRRLIESGQTIDQVAVDKLLSISEAGSKRHDQDFKITGLWILPVAPGLAIFSFFLPPEAQTPLLGVAAMLLCMAVGFLGAGKIAERWYQKADDSALEQLKG